MKFSDKELEAIFVQTAEPKVTQQATEQVIKILNSNYDKTDLHDFVANAHSLNNKQKDQLLALLLDFQNIFNGTLGHWKTEPVEIKFRIDLSIAVAS